MSLRFRVRGSLFLVGLLAPITAFFVLLSPSEYVAQTQDGTPSWSAMLIPLGLCLLLIGEIRVLRWAVMKTRGELLRHVPTIILIFTGLLSLVVASQQNGVQGQSHPDFFYTGLAFMLFFMAWLVRRRRR